MTTAKKKVSPALLPVQNDLFTAVAGLIEEARRTLARQANSGMVCLFWRIGQQINSDIL